MKFINADLVELNVTETMYGGTEPKEIDGVWQDSNYNPNTGEEEKGWKISLGEFHSEQ